MRNMDIEDYGDRNNYGNNSLNNMNTFDNQPNTFNSQNNYGVQQPQFQQSYQNVNYNSNYIDENNSSGFNGYNQNIESNEDLINNTSTYQQSKPQKPISYSDEYEYNNIEIRRNKPKVNKGLLILVCLIFAYIGFLILGILDTTYKTNDDGTQEAVVADLAARTAREDYREIKAYYLEIIKIMELVDTYEIQIEQKTTPYFTLSTKYSDILTTIDAHMTAVKGLDVDDKYVSLTDQMFNTYNSIAIYCQKMSTSLLNDDYNTYAEAMTWKQSSEEYVENLRKNLITFGESDAKIFNDKDLANSRIEDVTNDNPMPTPTITTGNYGEEIVKPTTTPTPIPTLGGNRLDDTTNNDDNSNNDNDNDDGNVSIENPYGN